VLIICRKTKTIKTASRIRQIYVVWRWARLFGENYENKLIHGMRVALAYFVALVLMRQIKSRVALLVKSVRHWLFWSGVPSAPEEARIRVGDVEIIYTDLLLLPQKVRWGSSTSLIAQRVWCHCSVRKRCRLHGFHPWKKLNKTGALKSFLGELWVLGQRSSSNPFKTLLQ